jgi:hypothetical protein
MPFVDPLFPFELSDLPPDWREMVEEREAMLRAEDHPDARDHALAVVFFAKGREDPSQIAELEARFGVAWPELDAAFGAPPRTQFDTKAEKIG